MYSKKVRSVGSLSVMHTVTVLRQVRHCFQVCTHSAQVHRSIQVTQVHPHPQGTQLSRLVRLALCAAILFAVWCIGASAQSVEQSIGQSVAQSAAQTTPQRLQVPEPSDGYRELSALQASYPGRIHSLQKIDNDWSVMVDSTRFWWASGRMLPAELRHRYEEFQTLRFYRYYTGALVQYQVTPEQQQRLTQFLQQRSSTTTQRHNGFLSTLYGIDSRAEADQTIQSVRFLGFTVKVHPLIVEPLRRVEQRISRLAYVHPEVADYLSTISTISGYHWRTISGTNVRSNHAYGTAVDLLSNDYRQQHVYWLWSTDLGNERWWEIPLEQRWSPPQAIIDSFEQEGFVWGGKWIFFDTVHFEYRPEILRLARR